MCISAISRPLKSVIPGLRRGTARPGKPSSKTSFYRRLPDERAPSASTAIAPPTKVMTAANMGSAAARRRRTPRCRSRPVHTQQDVEPILDSQSSATGADTCYANDGLPSTSWLRPHPAHDFSTSRHNVTTEMGRDEEKLARRWLNSSRYRRAWGSDVPHLARPAACRWTTASLRATSFDFLVAANLPRSRRGRPPQLDLTAPPVGPADPRASMPQRIASAAADEGARPELAYNADAHRQPGDVAREGFDSGERRRSPPRRAA